MPKPSPKSTALEILHPGQPSVALLAELKALGGRVSASHLANAIIHLEASRVGFVCEAIATGILLCAKKETLAHGERQKFDAQVWEEVERANRTRASDLSTGAALDNFTRSLRVYRFCAQHFLADLEQNRFQPERTDQKVLPPAIKPSEALALDTLPEEKRVAVYGAIEHFVAGRSLRRMLADFRRAESAADEEETDEADRRRKKVPAGDPGQMDFYADMQRPLDEIDRLFEDSGFVEQTDRKFWLKLAESLDTQAKRARALAKEMAS